MQHVAVAALLGALVSGTAHVDQPGQKWISSTRVIHMLEAKGYRAIKIEADDGHWRVRRFAAGATFDFHVNPHSGRITKLERDGD
jgi:hypothetical protein